MNYSLRLLYGLLFGLLPLFANAQGEYANWYFGQQAGLRFATGSAPQPLPGSAMIAASGCATLSDAAGNLLFYTNGEQVWNRQHQVMAGGQSLGGNTRAAQGCAVLRVQGAAIPTAYVLTQQYSSPAGLFAPGIPVAAEIQLNGAGGLGQVAQTGLPVVADSILLRLGERQFAPYQALVRHANGRDCWLLTRLHQQGIFLATLLDGTGRWPCARTVVSRVLPSRIASSALRSGALVASPDGRTLLYNDVGASYLLRFDPVTGQVSAPLPLTHPAPTIPSDINPYALGGTFSPDGTRLYLNRIYQPGANYNSPAVQVVQYDLSAGTAAAVAASGMEIYNVAAPTGTGNVPWYSQRGVDGVVYFSVNGAPFLDAILSPNVRGRACRYTPAYQQLGGRNALLALPVQPNDVNLGPLLVPEAAFGCVGQRITLRAGAGTGGGASDSLRWLPGDGRAATNTLAAVDTLNVIYAASGTFSLRIERRRLGVVVAMATASVRISAAPRVRLALAPDTVGCAPLNLRLLVGIQPAGSVFSWQDGSTGTALVATAPGLYWVDVQNSAGCRVRATVQVREQICAASIVSIPNIITPNGDAQNQSFVLQGLNVSDWSVHLYSRWGREIFAQAKYDNSWAAQGQPDGVYYYLLTNAQTGQKYKGWAEVKR